MKFISYIHYQMSIFVHNLKQVMCMWQFMAFTFLYFVLSLLLDVSQESSLHFLNTPKGINRMEFVYILLSLFIFLQRNYYSKQN